MWNVQSSTEILINKVLVVHGLENRRNDSLKLDTRSAPEMDLSLLTEGGRKRQNTNLQPLTRSR